MSIDSYGWIVPPGRMRACGDRSHPNMRPDEMWITNTDSNLGRMPWGKVFHGMGFKTARLGPQAYDMDGRKIDPDFMRPVFVQTEEVRRMAEDPANAKYAEMLRAWLRQ